MKTRTKIIIAALITAFGTFIITTAGIAALGIMLYYSSAGSDIVSQENEISRILNDYYLYDFDEKALKEHALKEYVNALDEPYTKYYTPEEFRPYLDSFRDGYTGIGIIVSVSEDDKITVIDTLDESPAREAGVEPGDIIKSVEGKDYSGKELNDAIAIIRGDRAGTNVNITFIKNNGNEVNLDILRKNISDKTVEGLMLTYDTAYISIKQFNERSKSGSHSTSIEFRKEVNELKNKGARKLIIDLRDNPGGVLEEAVNIADILLPEGLITYTEDKNGKRVEYNSDAKSVDMPIVVLINGRSASASEVLTGALKDRGKATVVGEKSFGKGIVQTVYALPGGGGISLTTNQYFTPSGVCIHGIGIEPDVTVSLPEEFKDSYASQVDVEHDTQFKRALEIIEEK